MQTILLHCPRRARFHFGKVGLGENMALNDTGILPHSDTLFSALINTAALFPQAPLTGLIDAFKAGQLSISSGGFCWQVAADDYLWFLPKPALSTPASDRESASAEEDNSSWRKDFAKVQFLSKGVWESDLSPRDWLNAEKCLILDGKFVLTQAEAKRIPDAQRHARTKLYQIVNLPKVRVHAADQQRGFFGQAAVQLGYWNEHCRVHYYFLSRQELSEDLAHYFRSVLNLLVDQGIGGERRVGCGQLEGVDWRDDLNDLATTSDGLQVSLALFNPASAEELAACLSYQAIMRGGRRITVSGVNEVYLKRIRMIREGAISTQTLNGQLVNINPEAKPHPFYRLGRHFSIPLPQNLERYVTN